MRGPGRRAGIACYYAFQLAAITSLLVGLVIYLTAPGPHSDVGPWPLVPMVGGAVVGALLGARSRVLVTHDQVVIQNAYRRYQIPISEVQDVQPTEWIGQLNAVLVVAPGCGLSVKAIAVGPGDLPRLIEKLHAAGWRQR